MNDKLKFRVYDKLRKIFLPAILNGWIVDTGYDTPCWQNLGELLSFKHYTVQQWSGLVDKNGTDIFIGDIVQYNNNTMHDGVDYEVEELDEGLGFCLVNKDGDILINTQTYSGEYRFKMLEVVGNIFDKRG